MKKHFFVLFALPLAFALSSGCEKTLELSGHETQPALALPEVSAADRDAPPGSGISILPQDFSPSPSSSANQFSIVYKTSTGGTTQTFYFTEPELATILANAGVSANQIAFYIQTLFHSVNTTGALVHEVGGFIAQGWNGVPANAIENSYKAGAATTGNFEPPKPPGSEYVGCPPGTITFINNECSLNLGEGIVIPGSWFTGIRLRKVCPIVELFEIALSVQDIVGALIASGMNSTQANQTLVNFINGQMSTRDAWNLFQFRVLPHLPAYQQFVQQNGGIEVASACWRLHHVGCGLYFNNGAASNFVFMIGDAPLFCGPHT